MFKAIWQQNNSIQVEYVDKMCLKFTLEIVVDQRNALKEIMRNS